MKLLTWTVMCLYRSSLLTNAARELARYKLNLVGVQEEKVLQGMTDKLIEIGSCYGMEMNVEKQKAGHVVSKGTVTYQDNLVGH